MHIPRSDLDLVTVVGKSIILPQIPSPTKEDIDKYHQVYIDALVDLFNRNKIKYAADPKSELMLF